MFFLLRVILEGCVIVPGAWPPSEAGALLLHSAGTQLGARLWAVPGNTEMEATAHGGFFSCSGASDCPLWKWPASPCPAPRGLAAHGSLPWCPSGTLASFCLLLQADPCRGPLHISFSACKTLLQMFSWLCPTLCSGLKSRVTSFSGTHAGHPA